MILCVLLCDLTSPFSEGTVGRSLDGDGLTAELVDGPLWSLSLRLLPLTRSSVVLCDYRFLSSFLVQEKGKRKPGFCFLISNYVKILGP